VAPREFSFAFECSDPTISPGMLRDLVAQVLGHAGCGDDVERAATAAIEAVVAGSGARQQLGLQFRAHAGRLSIAVSSGDRQVWQTSCPIP